MLATAQTSKSLWTRERAGRTWVCNKKSAFKLSELHASLWSVMLSNFSLGSCLSYREFPTCFKGLGGLKWSWQMLWFTKVAVAEKPLPWVSYSICLPHRLFLMLSSSLCCVTKQGIKEVDWDEKSFVCLVIAVYIFVLYSSLHGDIKTPGPCIIGETARRQEHERGGGEAGLSCSHTYPCMTINL